MTAKEGYFGSDAKENRFLAIPSGKGKNEKYFMQVNKDTGRMEVWNEEFGQDRKVGFLDPGSNEFVPDKTFTKGARGFEKDFFSTDEGKKLIREQSKNTVVKEKIAEGKDITEARKEAEELERSNQKITQQKVMGLLLLSLRKQLRQKMEQEKNLVHLFIPRL